MADKAVRKNLEDQLRGLEHIGVVLDTCSDDLEDILRIGFFRISQIAKQIHTEEPNRKTTVCDIVKIFHYEQSLRGELSEYISYLEVQMRSILSAYYTEWYGAHGYRERKYFSEYAMIHGTVVAKVAKQLKMKSLYEVVDDKQIDERSIEEIPVWIAMELSTFQMLHMFIQILPQHHKDEIASHFDISADTLLSWMDYLLVVRNACAHQGLLFNRRFNRVPLNAEGREASVGTAFFVLHKLLNYEPYYSIKNELHGVVLGAEDAWINVYFDMFPPKN